MEKKQCAYCSEIAVAYQVNKEGKRVPICAYHIPIPKGDLPELRATDGVDGEEN